MRTAVWSLAALAGGALAAPGADGWGKKPEGYNGGDSWGSSSSSWGQWPPVTGWSSSSTISSSSESSSTSTTSESSSSSSSSISSSSASSSGSSSVQSSFPFSPVTQSSSSSTSSSGSIMSSTPSASISSSTTPVGPGSYTYSFTPSKKSTSSVATSSPLSSITKSVPVKPSSFSSGSSIHSGSTTYVTKVTTIYTTVCPGTWTHLTTWTSDETTKTDTLTSTYMTTSTVTSVYTSTVTTSVPKSTPVSPEKPKSTVTKVTTVYTTVCPATKTHTSEGQTWTTTFQTTSTVTSEYLSTVTIPVSPVVPEKKTTVTDVTTLYTTVCPVTMTHSSDDNTWTTTYETTSTATSTYQSTITVTAVPVGPTEKTTVTDMTTVYTTVCPATQTQVNGETTLTKTYETTSTVTSVYQSTITVTEPATMSWTDEPMWSTVPWGTTDLSYAVTIPFNYGGTTTTPTATTSVIIPTGKGNSTISGSIKKSASKPSGSATKKSMISGSAKSSYKSTGSITKPSSTTSSKMSTPTTCVPCEGQPGNDPESWCGYTVHDNSYEVMPITCKTVEYDLYLSNITLAADGVARTALVFNGQMPGPKIEANWGDTIIVHLHNQVVDNGTSIHFHGVRQNYTNEMDGVPSITQCPLAPGESQTYTFKASNYGSSWYHSHYALQLYDGAYGPMVIHGPASAEYDEEEFIVIQDWNHVGVNVLYDASQTVGNAPSNGPQTLDTGLINGKNVFNLTGTPIGERFQMKVTSGKTYRLRLVNTAIQTSFKFYLDQHTFQVIAADYVPLKPYSTNVLNIHTGQRYDVIFKANQPVGNYWLRADGQQTCTQLKNSKDIKAIVSYEGAPAGLPTSTAYTYVEGCVDEPVASIVPVVTIPAGPQSETITENIFIGGNGGTPNLYKWTLSGTTFQSQYGDPSLISITNNGTVPDYSGSLAIEVPKLGEWVYVIIESVIPVPHPMHLHGHDFQVLAQGYGSYSSSTPLNTASPARRDTVLMPGDKGQGGFVVIAFITDNPGAWLMHCHIGWHAAMGFALQIIENLDGIVPTVEHKDANNEVCADWHSYAQDTNFVVGDSGI